jgi:hypothetical protein
MNQLQENTKNKAMPVAIVKSKTKISPGYVRPDTGKVKIYVESSSLVDVYIVSNQQAEQIVSPAAAAALGILNYPGRMFVNNEIVTLPLNWQGGWKLVIGNPNDFDVAVYHMVWNA